MSLGTGAGRDEGGLAWWEQAVLTVLLDRSGNGKTVNHWTHQRLAGWIGCSPRSVKRWLDGLRERGWVEWCHNQHRGRDGIVRQLANSYVLLIPGWVQERMDAANPSGKKKTARASTSGPGAGSAGRRGSGAGSGGRVDALAGRAGGLPPRRRPVEAGPVRPAIPDVAELGLPAPGDVPKDREAAARALANARAKLRRKPPP